MKDIDYKDFLCSKGHNKVLEQASLLVVASILSILNGTTGVCVFMGMERMYMGSCYLGPANSIKKKGDRAGV